MRWNWKRKRTLLILVLLAVPLSGLVLQPAGSRASPGIMQRLLEEAEPPAATGQGPALCLGGGEFMAALGRDLAHARRRVFVQTLTFEGDVAGSALAEALIHSPAAEKYLLIDSYALFLQSDKFVGSPPRLLDLPLYCEAQRMRDLVARLRAAGVQVAFGRPFGPGRDNLAARDHKKICVVDDVAYLGGINFSDHNFLWRDLMLRSEDPAVAAALAADFRRSWRGISRDTTASCDGLDLVIGAGEGSPRLAEQLAGVIAAARGSIYVECPYITEPWFQHLAAARARGVQVTIVTSEHINRLGMKWSIMEACARHDLQLRLLDGTMTHVKALLVDDRVLVLGSANFDFLSGTLQPEVAAVVTDTAVVAQFDRRVRRVSLARSRIWAPPEGGSVLGPVGRGLMAAARGVLTGVHTR
jgi:cardiolipin synthase